MSSIRILSDICVGCKLCLNSCPYGAIHIVNKKAAIAENCTLCGACADSCKFSAIEYTKEELLEAIDISSFKGVWVFAEQKKGKAAGVVTELLGEGRNLAGCLDTKLYAVLLGSNVENTAKELISYGADVVYFVNDQKLEHFNDELYADIFSQLAVEYKPEIILFGATAYGRSLAPRVASRLNTGLTADCTRLEIDPEKRILLQTRPAFGGNIMATIICPDTRPQMSTVRPKVMKPPVRDLSRKGEIIQPGVVIPEKLKTNTKEVITTITDSVSLADAEIIVSGGLGMGGPENFVLLEELAHILGGAVGASRAAVDSGWIDYIYQIGQTGKTVSPKLYFACGISGAIQHIAGMSSSDTIIAINKNPDAPIFKYATYGIVGDVKDVLPALIREFKTRAK